MNAASSFISKLRINEGRHIISTHRHTSDVDASGRNAVSDYAAAVRHVSRIDCGERWPRVFMCWYAVCLCASASVVECVPVCDWMFIIIRCFMFLFYTFCKYLLIFLCRCV